MNTAALIKGMSVEAFKALEETDPSAFKADRQRAKAINFGVPGGLGAASLMAFAANTWGVVLTPEQATSLREALITKVYPELTPYLADDLMVNLARNLGADVAACWNALDQSGERPDWLPSYVRNIVSGRTHRKDGDPYDPSFLNETWSRLLELNVHPDLVAALASQQGSLRLASACSAARP